MSYSSEVLADSPNYYYRLGEPSGFTMVDSSGAGRDGAYNSVGGIATNATGLLAGDANTAITINGTANNRGVATSDNATQAPSLLTVEARIKPAAVSGTYSILTRYNTAFTTSSFTLRLDANKVALYVFHSGSLTSCTGSTSLVAGTSYTVAATYNRATGAMEVFVNGVSVGTATAGGAYNNSVSCEMTVGCRPSAVASGSQEPFSGTLDEVALYPSILSSTRLLAHHTAATTVTTQYAASGTIAATSDTTSSAAGVRAAASGTVAGVTAAAGSTTLRAGAAGTATATSGVTGSASSTQDASGTVAVTSGATGATTSLLGADGTVAGTSGTSADVIALLVATGQADALSALLGSATRLKVASGTIVVVSGVRGAATIPQPPVDTPPARTLVVAHDNRTLPIAADIRLLTVGADNRTLTVATEIRAVGVAP